LLLRPHISEALQTTQIHGRRTAAFSRLRVRTQNKRKARKRNKFSRASYLISIFRVLICNKPADRKGKVILIDGSTIYTPQRAQNIMTDDDVERAYKLYADYEDVIDLAKVVTIEDIAAKDYTLSVNTYIEKTQQETVDPAVVRQQYFDAVAEVAAAEAKLIELLKKEGYINE
jgi:type I restriction enzyme M protein